MKRILTRLFMIPGVVVVSGALALAQQNPGSMPPSNAPSNNPAGMNNPNNPNSAEQMQMQREQNAAAASMQDKAFVKKAAQGGMAEVRLGELAQQKGSSQDVKDFGQKMVNDHTQLNQEMKPIAQQMGVSGPQELSKKDKKEIAKLENLSGQQFDQTYIKMMIKDHKKDLSEFRQEANNTQNSQLKQAAQHGAQVIDGHLQMAEKIAKDHNISAKGE